MYHLGMALVEVDAVSKSYARRAGLHTEMRTVVDNVSFSISAGETLGLVGESGSGKTTVARMILGLVRPTHGCVRVDGIDVARASRSEMQRIRRQMQPVFQDPFAALNPRMKVLEIVTEPWMIHGNDLDGQIPRGHAALRTRAVELLREVGLDESALGRHPHEFSGGQRQRAGPAAPPADSG
jgi:ABC-type glutathione transport system ATPase component